jgi:general secretion pathway protein M
MNMEQKTLARDKSEGLPRHCRFERMGLKLTVSGDIAALDAALLDLSTYTPLLLVESIEIWPERRSGRKDEAPEQTLTATLELLSLRALQ